MVFLMTNEIFQKKRLLARKTDLFFSENVDFEVAT